VIPCNKLRLLVPAAVCPARLTVSWRAAESRALRTSRFGLPDMNGLSQRWRNLPRALRGLLIALCWLLIIGGYLLWQYLRPQGAALYGHNHTQRPIFSYWVNDKWGGNGGVACCSRIQGDTLKIVWLISRTQEQIDRGDEQERHELELSNPPRQREDDTLHVHFLPDNQVRLAWSRSATSPLAKELLEQFPRKRHDNL
jgi:hypothetical protein